MPPQTPPPTTPDQDRRAPADPSQMERVEGTGPRWGLIIGTTFLLATFGLWVFAIFIYDPGLLVDELEDRTFPLAAEPVCAAALAEVEALPRAEATDDPVERADVIDQADAILAAMVADLRPLAPTEPPEAAEAVNEWLDDWETHLEDREAYATALRSDPDARFVETVKGAKQVSRAIDGYAQVNRMNSCETPGDVG